MLDNWNSFAYGLALIVGILVLIGAIGVLVALGAVIVRNLRRSDTERVEREKLDKGRGG